VGDRTKVQTTQSLYIAVLRASHFRLSERAAVRFILEILDIHRSQGSVSRFIATSMCNPPWKLRHAF
jgi:hypothetical protein